MANNYGIFRQDQLAKRTDMSYLMPGIEKLMNSLSTSFRIKSINMKNKRRGAE
jgi:hypothetical protein